MAMNYNDSVCLYKISIMLQLWTIMHSITVTISTSTTPPSTGTDDNNNNNNTHVDNRG